MVRAVWIPGGEIRLELGQEYVYSHDAPITVMKHIFVHPGISVESTQNYRPVGSELCLLRYF
jgi:hypothetical protein